MSLDSLYWCVPPIVLFGYTLVLSPSALCCLNEPLTISSFINDLKLTTNELNETTVEPEHVLRHFPRHLNKIKKYAFCKMFPYVLATN